ncbi:MAG: hypothetical protein QM669_13165 [Siphonobacter sp.]
MSVIIAKTGLSILLILLISIILYFKSGIIKWFSNKKPTVYISIGWVLFRLIPFVVLYILAGYEPTSDVNGFWDEASKASVGQMVYRDFWSPYSPFYAYYLGLWLKLWYMPKMIVLTMAIMDGLAVLISYFFYRPIFSNGTFIFKALLYYLLPGSLLLCIVAAQEDVWMWLFLTLAFLTRKRYGVVAYSLILVIGLLTTKIIFVLILIPIFLLEKDKIRFLLPLFLVGTTTLVILYLLVGTEFLQPLGEANTLRAPNVFSIVNPWFFNSIGVGLKIWNWLGLGITVGVGCLTAWKFRKTSFEFMLSRTWVMLYGTMMIIQQSAYSNYIFLFLIPLTFLILDWDNKKQVIFFLIYNLLCVVHPSFWWRLELPKYVSPGSIFTSTDYILDYSMQVGIVLLTIYFLKVTYSQKRDIPKAYTH